MEVNKVNSVVDYIASFPDETRKLLELVRATIREAVPAEATEKISYAMPTFYLNGNLVHFAAYQNHIGFYPGASGIANFQDEISGYKNSKGAVQFPIGKPIPFELITQIVKFRVNENLQKKRKK
jgi:uncharacterized protein YdhG (YjbR/CyaY superfamily)